MIVHSSFKGERECGVCLLHYYAWILPWTVGLLVNNLTHAQFMFPLVLVIESYLVVVGIIACCGVFSGQRGIDSKVLHAQVARDMTVDSTLIHRVCILHPAGTILHNNLS